MDEVSSLGVPIELIGIYPTPEVFPNDPSATPDKLAYIVQDVVRLARERGLKVGFPPPGDPDWSIAHAAFLAAQQRGAGRRFMLEAFRQRFSAGADLGDDSAIAEAARRAELDPDDIVTSAHSDALRAEAAAGWRRGSERDHIFGVPSFVYAGKLYWGQDRMHFLRSAVERKAGRTT